MLVVYGKLPFCLTGTRRNRIMMNFPRVCPDIQNYNILNRIVTVLIKYIPLKIAKPTGKSYREGIKRGRYLKYR